MNDELLTNFKVKEVWRALKQMHPTQSMGSNGLEFFKIFKINLYGPIGVKGVVCGGIGFF